MLPAHLAENIRQQVLFYLQSTFDFREHDVEKAFNRFLTDPEQGLFKGPWVQLRRPYRPADPGEQVPFDFPVDFHPFKHQNRSWRRLNSKTKPPQPTIVTTGTGSGKTECFLFPILDHCLRARQKGEKGIKAIILYPMNALAADQEKRFAKVIYRTPALRKAGIRVGNYTGRYDPSDPGASADSGTKAMGKACGISNHGAQQENPPDILLTNYKMLDYLLLRPQDQRLWRFNEPGVLQYLVLDELHTYDGAQGADVACLIRRLKERLSIPRGSLCAIGTSATLDDRETDRDSTTDQQAGNIDARETGSDRLARFASTLFEEDISAEAVIGEDRLTVAEIIALNTEEVTPPPPEDCHPRDDEDALKFARRQAEIWGGPVYLGPPIPENLLSKDEDRLTDTDRDALQAIEEWSVQLGTWLKSRILFKYLLELFEQSELKGSGPVTWRKLVESLAREDLSFNDYPKAKDRSAICASFFALVAQAREIRSEHAFPLVPTQVQLWIRELRRLGRQVHEKPIFTWLDEPTLEFPSLPVFHCSECGESGWIGLADPSSETKIGAKGVTGFQVASDPSQIYRSWFGFKGVKSPSLVVFSPWKQEEVETTTEISNKDTQQFQQQFTFKEWYVCPKSLVIRQEDGPCPLTSDPKRFRIRLNAETRLDSKQNIVGDQGCPNCGSREGVFFIGSQSATLSSVAIDELFGSVLNNDPKLLAFTDSVQDASHRAGFFSSRTYQFTFRTALQHVIDAAGPQGISLADAGGTLLDWWSQPRPGWPGSVREAMASLMPPDLHEYPDFLRYREEKTNQDPPPKLRDDIERRLTWEAISEFGLMQTHGRRMEPAASSSVTWDPHRIEATVKALQERMPGIDSALTHLTDQAIQLWIYGFLHRARIRGAMDHPYLDSYAKNGFWGKYPYGRTIPGRETYPGGGRYKPSLLVTQSQKNHEHVLATSGKGNQPWQLVWARRALQQPEADETSLLDLIAALLESGTDNGLFRKIHQDGSKKFYTISAYTARLTSDPVNLVCSESNKPLIRPAAEADLWEGAPSWEYYSHKGHYARTECNTRQKYYQNRYRKGALRRVVASEHTGLLATADRERLELEFSRTQHTDDPNVLTCTSTLEMGIDIGDLSSTMLCSIPPSTASYLQRIGRAGRSTGTALIVSVVNQRPHDLFFYGRPAEMLRGKVDPPGCWLDASAVLVRQYLAYAFDSATQTGELTELPKSGKQLIEDMAKPDGHIPRMLQWVTQNESELRSRFLKRLQLNVQEDTRERFISETDSDLLLQKIHYVTGEFERMTRDLENARKRLRVQLNQIDEEENDAREDIEQELRILKGRLQSLSRTTALEILTDNGLLPNYAFPERGVRFYGAIYNKHRKSDQEHKPIEVTRAASVALKELAPGNHFYTHSRSFDIQQIAIGNQQDPLIFTWAICGACGHMRPIEELNKPETQPACPQCGHDRDSDSQLDQGQQRKFIEFSRSQALSYMEHYESLSGDHSEERNREYYHTIRSFDLTKDTPSGAVGEESLPFGIEYRDSIIMREVNVGYQGEKGLVPFGVDQMAPEEGFRVCRDCGIAVPPGTSLDKVGHRRSCARRRANEKRRQEGRAEQSYNWESIYLYRELKSEAIRLLLPIADDYDIDTLTACIHLGLRLRFEGNPAHLIVTPQIMPDPATGMKRYYVVLLDGVPGGTGYLKTLYQEKDEQNREGEGILKIMRLALNALETCVCRRMQLDLNKGDSDGCYRCIRSYHLQYKADNISSARGIKLLNKLIAAGEKRQSQEKLSAIKPNSLFGSMLEKKFVDTLETFVLELHGQWEQTIIRGNLGFRFSLLGGERFWELELQPSLGTAQGVSIQSQPDFLLRSDDDRIKPVAIFTDGFQYHCHPVNRLADDFNKRRSIIESGKYHVWSVTWDDLDASKADQIMVCHGPIAQVLQQYANASRGQGKTVPDARKIISNGLLQLKAFLATPHAPGWSQLATFVTYYPLQMLASQRTVHLHNLQNALEGWRPGKAFSPLKTEENGNWVFNDKTGLNQDLISYMTVEDAVSNRQSQVITLARLGDTEAETTGSDFNERWRRFLACLNLYQFSENFLFWASSECETGIAPEIPIQVAEAVSEDWKPILDEILPSLKSYIQELANAELPLPDSLPVIEYFNEQIEDDAFAELAWPKLDPPIALIAGDQEDFASEWQQQGWIVVTPDDLQAKGITYLIDLLTSNKSGA